MNLVSPSVISLDGEWLLAPDPKNVGRDDKWWKEPRPEAKVTKVPWIIQDAFPGYHGVAWYWRELAAPENPHAKGRYLLRFWAVDYKADVWLNDQHVGEHEGGESPFVLDVTEAIKSNAVNRLAVRVLNPTHEPIDGIVLNETPHRNKALPYGAGSAWDQGGIMDSVELLVVPAVHITDLFARPDWKTGEVRLEVTAYNSLPRSVRVSCELTVAPAASGETIAAANVDRQLSKGETTFEATLQVNAPHLWNLNDPFLYSATARVRSDGSGQSAGSDSLDERSVRFGFRDFRFENGYFRLNGKRLYLRCSHTGNCTPVGLELPHDPDLLRRDLLNVKVMGFNAIRFIAGVAKRYQLDLCDELGLMVYEESYAGWCLADSPKMPERYNESVFGMVKRDRNHPSVTLWGLLNETPDGPVFRHAASVLPKLRQLDDTRMVLLNSGRWDSHGGDLAGLEVWRNTEREDPCVTRNPTEHILKGLGITWQPGQMAFHPGRNNEYGVVRWTAPATGSFDIEAKFTTIAEHATTDVHILHKGMTLFDGFINVQGGGPEAVFRGTVTVEQGDTVDCAVGYGNGNYGADTTSLSVAIKEPQAHIHDAARDFGVKANPNGAWSYGQYAAAEKPDASTFALFPKGMALTRLGTLSNPGSKEWQDLLDDQHPYQRVPHTADIIRTLRTIGGGRLPLFLSEYGIGSAVDLWRTVRHYEQIGKAEVEDAQFYADKLNRFLADWERWNLADTFGRPEDFFSECLKKMAGQRLLGLNALRSNPAVVGHSLTGTVDQGMTGEGLFTTFRELKPGTVDAVFEGFAPLRWCLFVEPVNVYRGSRVRLEAVLANEDALLPGEYPARLQVLGPHATPVFDRKLTITIPDPHAVPEPPMVLPVFSEDVVIDGPPGQYRFLATFESGAAATGGETEFYVADAAEMPPVETEVTLWGEDPELAKWLTDHGIRTRRTHESEALTSGGPVAREVLLVSSKPPAGDASVWQDLARRVARGCTAVFLSPEVFAKGDQPAGWLPLVNKGTVGPIPSWLYLKDEWAKRHPIFDGLPCGGLMDYTFYRELIPDVAFSGQDPPAEVVAGAIRTSQDYSSGLLVSVYNLGAGRFILNTLNVRQNLGTHPAAERMLRNMIRYAARDADKPLAGLPADFDEKLTVIGYM